MEADALLDLFDRLALRVAVALAGLDDWGLSGRRDGQYRHDVVADEIIGTGLAEAGLTMLSEESDRVGDGPMVVVVDPVDGSTNGSRGLPWYAVSLCAVDADGPSAAVVVNLADGRRYRAVRGSGARRDRSPIMVGPEAVVLDERGGPVGRRFGQAEPIGPSGCRHLSSAILGFSGLPPRRGPWAQFRALGAAALDLCAVADGTLDGFVDMDRAHGVWDYLGAWLVCREAGVPMVDVDGDDLVVLDRAARRGPVAAATPELLAQIREMVAAWP